MSSIDERPKYYQRIDAALERRHKLACAVEALSKETQSKYTSSDVRDLIDVLRSSATAEQFVQDGSKAIWLPLILRGASSDSPSEEFEQIVKDVAFAAESQKSRQRNFAYPFVLFGAAVLLFVFLAKAVIPTFQQMFREFELKLPAITNLVFSISDQINYHTGVFCLLLVIFALACWWIRRLFQWCIRHTQITRLLGGLTTGNTDSVKAMGRFTSTLAELLNIDAPLNDAIRIAGRASQDLWYRNASETLSRDIGSSGKFNHSSSVAHNFPSLVACALAAGPNGGPSIPLLRQVSAVYVDRVRNRFSWYSGLVAPVWIIVVGFFVGFVVISIFMPLVQLITSLSG